MKMLALSIMVASAGWAGAAERDARCFELRTYYAAPGKLEALHARFRDHTMNLFAKHGMTHVGYWVPSDNPDHRLIYLLAYPSQEARDAAWKAFSTDPAWQAAYKASITEGRLVKQIESVFLQATDYSPPIRAQQRDPARVFELRTYLTPEGKLEALNQRFREHTVELFSKHGMSHFGYWVPSEEQQGAGHTLIYLLAHQDAGARDRSFAAFRADPVWLTAKAASEKEGSLTLEVKSVLLQPTDYSPTQ